MPVATGQSLQFELVDELDDRTLGNLSEDIVIDLRNHFQFVGVEQQLVLMETVLGPILIEMLPQAAPGTVQNFLNYVDDGDYDNSIIHRSVPGFVLQGGGFIVGNPPTAIPTDDPIVNEFQLSNLRGTLSMAKTNAGPDTATSQWFINLADNSLNLDSQNGGFTVFARVVGSGMEVADVIELLPRFNLGGAFTELPFERFVTVVQAEDLVDLPSVRRIERYPVSGSSAESAILFEVSGTNSEIVTAGLDGAELRLTLNNYRAGSSDIIVRATDIYENEIVFDFTVTTEREEAEYTNIDLSEFNFEGESHSFVLNLDSNTVWTVEESIGWVDFSIVEGEGPVQITVTVEENAEVTSRVGTVSIGGIEYTITQTPAFIPWALRFFTQEQFDSFGDLAQQADPDDDGLSNWVELVLGLDPSDAKSRLRFDLIEDAEGLVAHVFPASDAVEMTLHSSETLVDWAPEDGIELSVIDGGYVIRISDTDRKFFQARYASAFFE